MITDLLAFVLVLVIAAMLLAPLESLYWWATRGAEEVDRDGKETSKIIAGKEVVASMMERLKPMSRALLMMPDLIGICLKFSL